MSTTDVIALDAMRTFASRSTADSLSASLWELLRGVRVPPRERFNPFVSEDHGMGPEGDAGDTLHRKGSRMTQTSETKSGTANDAVTIANLNVLDLTHDAICVRNMSGVIEYWNRAAEKLYGWTSDQAVGRVSHALFKTIFPVPLDDIEAEALRSGYWEGELVHMLKDGTRVTVASRWSLVRDEASMPIAILETNNDITERKRAQAERAKLEERLRQAEKMQAIGCFASGIAHDISNVISGILAYGEMLFDEAPENTSYKRHATQVLTAANRGRDLVDQILAYTRSQRGKRTPTDVCRMVVETLELVRSTLPETITLHLAIPDVPLVVMGDATQLHRIVMNLCSNAIHAMKLGGPLRVTVTPLYVHADRALSHGTLRPGGYVRLSVEDGGCGMDEATLARIFEPFFTTKEVGRGTGLGLALVSAIVGDFCGVIDVRSVPDAGSTFTIYIPMVDATNAAEADVRSAPCRGDEFAVAQA
jgi:PAS domain S-box-containing protein